MTHPTTANMVTVYLLYQTGKHFNFHCKPPRGLPSSTEHSRTWKCSYYFSRSIARCCFPKEKWFFWL